MPDDPEEFARARDHLIRLHEIHQAAIARAADPPRIGPESWRGPAYRAYAWRAAELGHELHEATAALAAAVALARIEVARAAA